MCRPLTVFRLDKSYGSAVLRKTLEDYCRQTAKQDILEILAIDDGSTDAATRAVESLARFASVPIRCLRKDHKGLAAGWNFGMREAKGDLILTRDDIILGATQVEEHVA